MCNNPNKNINKCPSKDFFKKPIILNYKNNRECQLKLKINKITENHGENLEMRQITVNMEGL